jgi:TfoX/Sxy family transcriptional regulator of competence genes
MMAKRPTMPKSDPEATAWFETLLPHDTRVVIRPMCGHRAAFINGHMFAGTFGPDVFVRLDERSRAELLTVEGTKPFEPMKGQPMMEYVQIPKRWLAEPPTAKSWIARSLECAKLAAEGPNEECEGRFASVEHIPVDQGAKNGTLRYQRDILVDTI